MTAAGRFVVVAAFVLFSWATVPFASADVIYDWDGECTTGCAGSGSGTLTLYDTYLPGTPLTFTDFISFSYWSTSGSYQIPDDASLTYIAGTLPVLSGPSVDFNIQGFDTSGFFSSSNFATGGSWTSAFPSAGVNDTGLSGTWTYSSGTYTVDEAPTLLLLGTGLAAVGLLRRRQP